MKKSSSEQTKKLFLEIYEAFSDEIFRFCLAKTRNRDSALDITQETFIKTWDYMRSGKQIDSARSFLYKIARNTIIDASRKKKPASLDAILEQDIASDISDSSNQLGNMLRGIDGELLRVRLRELPEHHYEILMMRFIQELTLAEIATIYSESENTISVRIHRALKHAQKIFNDYEL